MSLTAPELSAPDSPASLHLSAVLDTQGREIAAWLAEEREKAEAPFYSSVDIRHSGHKLAPVDTNIFPAGFNNLTASALEKAKALFHTTMERHAPGTKNVLLIPELHTRNLKYLENVGVLYRLLHEAGYSVALGRLTEETEPVMLEIPGIDPVAATAVIREGNRVSTRAGFVPDAIVVNNDFTSGPPTILCSIEQPVMPKPSLGWYQRRKSVHFTAYNRVLKRFCESFGLDPWYYEAIFERCKNINFHERTGLECVALSVEKIIHSLKAKYEQYGITSEPYVFIKADSGTYGMGIMTATSGDDVIHMNKKIRNKMNVIKEGAQNTEVIIQEGVPTVDALDGASSELLYYLVSGEVVGGITRSNSARDSFLNLNTPDMTLTPIPDADMHSTPLARSAGIIAQLATLAAAHEHYTDCDRE